MFTRQTTFHFKIDGLDKAIKIIKESIVPVAKSQKGYHGFYFMIDRKTGKAVAIVLWDSEEDDGNSFACFAVYHEIEPMIAFL